MKNFFALVLLLLPAILQAQSGSEIYLFDFSVKKGEIVLSHPVNITKRAGYDNQPSFHSKLPLVYYSSFDDKGLSDIKQYNYRSYKTQNLTKTPEREYSPTLSPDGFISCIIQRSDGKQDLGKYPVKGGLPIVLIDNLTIGYHAWINSEEVLIFVLDANNKNTLHRYNTLTKHDTVIAKDPGRSLHHIPGKNEMSFVQMDSTSAWKIKRYDIATKTISDITAPLPGREDLTWTTDGTIIMSDGSKLFWFKPGTSTAWKEIGIAKYDFMKGITRLAIDKNSRKLAVVVSE